MLRKNIFKKSRDLIVMIILMLAGAGMGRRGEEEGEGGRGGGEGRQQLNLNLRRILTPGPAAQEQEPSCRPCSVFCSPPPRPCLAPRHHLCPRSVYSLFSRLHVAMVSIIFWEQSLRHSTNDVENVLVERFSPGLDLGPAGATVLFCQD